MKKISSTQASITFLLSVLSIVSVYSASAKPPAAGTKPRIVELGRVADLLRAEHSLEAEVSDFAWFQGELYLVNGGWTGPHADPGGVFRVDRDAKRLVADLQHTNIETIPIIHIYGDEMIISAFDSDTYPARWWRKKEGKWEGRDFPALWGNYHVGGMLKIDDKTILATINDYTRTYPALGISTDDGKTWERFPSNPRPIALESFTHVGGFDFFFQFAGDIYAVGDGTRLPPGPEFRGGRVDPMLARIDVKAGTADLIYGRSADLFAGVAEDGLETMDRYGRAIVVHDDTLFIEFRNCLYATDVLDGKTKMQPVELGEQANIRDVIVSDGLVYVLSSWHHEGGQDPHRLWSEGPATTKIFRRDNDGRWSCLMTMEHAAHATSFERDPDSGAFYLGMMDGDKNRGLVLKVQMER
jgi:hypothetical protein